MTVLLVGAFFALTSAVLACAPQLAPDTSDTPPSSVAQGGSCGTGGSCCTSGGVACNDVTCCLAVCGSDPYCCNTAWDGKCVAAAQTMCGDLCSGGGSCPTTGDCCASHSGTGCEDATCCELVCNTIPSCCEAVWSQQCAVRAGELCDQCEPIVKCPGTGDCCIEHVPDAGCSDVKCCEIVCEIDIFCCRGEWDYVCASKAQQHCPHLCGCVHFGDFDHNANVDLLDFAALQNCFTAEGGAIGPECACADYDDDGDSDLFDFIYFGPH